MLNLFHLPGRLRHGLGAVRRTGCGGSGNNMIRTKRVVVQLTCVLASLFCAQAQAQSIEPVTADTSKQPVVEVTPFIGMGSPGSARAGAAVAFVLAPKFRIESEVAYASRALLSSSVNLVYLLPHLKAVEPYLTTGIGVGQNETASLASLSSAFVIQRSIVPVVNAGAGFTVPVRDNLGYRFDARWANPLGVAPESWRIYQGATLGVGRK